MDLKITSEKIANPLLVELLEKDDESRLFNQIIEHSYGLTYETVKETWQIIADVFQKAIEDEND